MGHVLVLNSGSSSLKFAVFEAAKPEPAISGTFAVADNASAHREAAQRVLEEIDTNDDLLGSSGIDAVGHRVVHGGTAFRQSVVIDAEVRARIECLNELAPLHNPPAVAALEAAMEAFPDIPHVAAFDTAFFADLPPVAQTYPLPYAWFRDWEIRRFGFHGISYAYCSGRTVELLGRPPAQLRMVICHLGSGCSACAIKSGRPLSTTMGFTPLEGLMMSTRSGSIDPGILLHLQAERGMSLDTLEETLNRKSGLLGVSGISADFREVESAAKQGNQRARLAIDLFADRIRVTIGGMAATLGGLDALVFTAGVGEHARDLRAQVCQGLECFGCLLDPDRNANSDPDADVAADESAVRILVVHTREAYQIAKEVWRLLGA